MKKWVIKSKTTHTLKTGEKREMVEYYSGELSPGVHMWVGSVKNAEEFINEAKAKRFMFKHFGGSVKYDVSYENV